MQAISALIILIYPFRELPLPLAKSLKWWKNIISDVSVKELSYWFSNPLFFATECRRTLDIWNYGSWVQFKEFENWNRLLVDLRHGSNSLNYISLKKGLNGCKVLKIRKLKFVAIISVFLSSWTNYQWYLDQID